MRRFTYPSIWGDAGKGLVYLALRCTYCLQSYLIAAMQPAGPLFHRDEPSVAGSAPASFLPTTRAEMQALGWEQCDVIIVTGDAYVDHPSFGMAIIGRVLEAQGFKVGIIAQPD